MGFSLLPRKYQFAANSDILLTSFDIFGILKKCIDTFGGERLITNERKNQFRNIIPSDLHKSFRTVLLFWFDNAITNQKAGLKNPPKPFIKLFLICSWLEKKSFYLIRLLNRNGDSFGLFYRGRALKCRIPTVKLEIPGKAFLKSETRTSVTFKL